MDLIKNDGSGGLWTLVKLNETQLKINMRLNKLVV